MSKFGIAGPRCACQNGLEDRLQLAGRTGDHTQHLGGRGLLLPRLGELTGARFELLFQLDQRIGPVANARSRLRSGRTKLVTECSAFRAFARQDHLLGTGPPSGRPSQGSSLSILTEPHDELAPPHHSITSSARASTVVGISRPSALAALRLMTSSYFVGAWTGRVGGCSPLSRRST